VQSLRFHQVGCAFFRSGTAQPYDTIIVCPGTYSENVLVDFSGNTEGVTITSTDVHNPDQTVLDGGFSIVSDYVTIKGFKIINGNPQGIGVEISGDYATVAFNHITQCFGAIRINQTPGVFASSFNTIAHNKINDNQAWGINVQGTDNVIHHNDVFDTIEDLNYGGILLANISYNGNIHHNNTYINLTYGIKVEGDNYNIHQNHVCDKIFLQFTADNIFLHQNEAVIEDNGATNVKDKRIPPHRLSIITNSNSTPAEAGSSGPTFFGPWKD
jgi:parallel beta-helix repeat protein